MSTIWSYLPTISCPDWKNRRLCCLFLVVPYFCPSICFSLLNIFYISVKSHKQFHEYYKISTDVLPIDKWFTRACALCDFWWQFIFLRRERFIGNNLVHYLKVSNFSYIIKTTYTVVWFKIYIIVKTF